MATIQIRRKLTGAVAAPPAAAAGELLFSVPGFTGGGPNALYINNGTAAVALVDSTRQVELAGAQTITGPKTFAAGAKLIVTDVPVAALDAANKAYVDTAMAGVTFNWGVGLSETVPGTVDVDQATQAALGGGMIATNALIAAGADDAALLTSLGLRSQLGADAATLPTTAKTVVPSIIEMFNEIAALTGVVIFAGTYAAATATGTYNGQGGIATGTGPLPAAAAANQGAYLIVTTAGAGGGTNEPAGGIGIGDWLLSDGAAWLKMPFSQAPLTAANVAVNPAVAGATNVQAALTAINTAAIAPVLAVATTFSGDGVTTPLDLLLADGGTF